eukprot:30139-Rhodomonas_salina.1
MCIRDRGGAEEHVEVDSDLRLHVTWVCGCTVRGCRSGNVSHTAWSRPEACSTAARGKNKAGRESGGRGRERQDGRKGTVGW